ncbi:HlyD family type I secretion periplasmic adaptor subunit [Paracoccus benzoatiresistens]|uniref:Membrane fusion protein (MFP) family protein n=1 Tax=Paracoccus benzoatiresistens TaxID=2997341 RepID=A0ABT4J0N1_9RHOB|nr:HlyD family type I secretion periplasmic adaptor subunit [Paracoccus sp. EF6]MCZ0960676.1 HlyD family type I secretion periplasmic adaptor subunit [Paracoccus sp. EF6]
MSVSEETPAAVPVWLNPRIEDRRPFGRVLIACGFAVIMVSGGAFYGWASTAPVAGAVVAPGVINVDSNVRAIQHLEGGILKEILVREGDPVQGGQVLLRLDDTATSSSRNELLGQYYEGLAAEARLLAEQAGADKIDFPKELTDKFGDAAIARAMKGQEDIFKSRVSLLAERLAIGDRTRKQLDSQIQGLRDQIAAAERRLALLREEATQIESLLAKNLVPITRQLDIRRSTAELEGEIASYQAAIATAEQRIEEEALRMADLRNTQANEVVEELRTTRARNYELTEQLRTAEDVLERGEIRSPVAGVVKGLQVHTIGGVISPGQTLMEIVPVSDKLVVQATIDPMDIDQVRPDMSAQVWLAALNRRTEAPFEGRVTTVSADRLVDQVTGAPYYLARVELDNASLADETVPIQAGMSAEVMIRTGDRTTWEYLMTPLVQFFRNSLRES